MQVRNDISISQYFSKKILSFQKVPSKKVRNKVNCTRAVEKKIGHLEKYAMVRKYAMISLLVNIFQKKFCPFKRYAVKRYAIKLTAQGRSKKKSATLKSTQWYASTQ